MWYLQWTLEGRVVSGINYARPPAQTSCRSFRNKSGDSCALLNSFDNWNEVVSLWVMTHVYKYSATFSENHVIWWKLKMYTVSWPLRFFFSSTLYHWQLGSVFSSKVSGWQAYPTSWQQQSPSFHPPGRIQCPHRQDRPGLGLQAGQRNMKREGWGGGRRVG